MALISKTFDTSASIDDFLKDLFVDKEMDEFNINFKSVIFDSKIDAMEFIDVLSDSKKDQFFVVRFRTPLNSFNETEEYADLMKSISHQKDLIENTPFSLFGKLKEQASSKKSCKVCKSAISKEFFVKRLEEISAEYLLTFTDIACPVCSDENFLFSGTEKKQFERWKEKLEVLNGKMELAKQKFLSDSSNLAISYAYTGEETLEVENAVDTEVIVEAESNNVTDLENVKDTNEEAIIEAESDNTTGLENVDDTKVGEFPTEN